MGNAVAAYALVVAVAVDAEGFDVVAAVSHQFFQRQTL